MNKTKPNTHKRMLVTLIAAISLWTFLIGLTKPASQTPLLGFSAVAATLEQEAAETTPTTEVPESELLTQLLEMTSEYASNYGLTPEMTDQELANVYLSLDSERSYAAWTELNEMVALSEGMTAADIHLLLEHPAAQLCDRHYAIIYQINTPVTIANHTINHTPLAGITITGTSDSSDYDASAGTVTIKVAGEAGVCGVGASSDTATINIRNSSTTQATISFDITQTKVNSLTANTGTLTESSFSVTLDANATATLTMTTATNSTENKVVFSNFTLTPVSSDAKATVTYDAQKGSVTLGGASVSNGGSATAIGGTLTAAATPASGCSFLGWINTDTGERLSPDTSTTLNVPQDISIQAVFVTTVSDTAWFMVDNKWLSNDLNAAAQLGKTVVLMNNGTLPASTSSDGVYTIPAGVTLLIPYDAAGTLCTEKPTTKEVDIVNEGKTPSVFRTLTMANGANITVNGAISVSGSQSSCYGYNGMPYGPLGFIDMKSGSTITVNNGANLYVWGYITGSGSVEIKSGGTVHEHFQIADYRGGDVTSQMAGKDDEYHVFPFNQYYIQNVEVPMTLHKGAVEKGRGSVTVTLAGVQALSVPFIGHTPGESMFVIQSGYIVKDYMEGTGRTEVKIYGDLSVSEVSLSMKVSLIGSLDIDSKKYALPIPHHFTMSLESGSINMNQNMAFLPGSELYIKEGTKCTLGENQKIYVYDLDQWLYNDGANGYSGTTNLPYKKVHYVPGGDGTTGRLKDALVQVDGTVDVSAGSAYVTSSGANIYSTGTGVVTVGSAADTKTYQVTTGGSDGTDITGWPEIKIAPAILQDADSTDVSTDTAGTYTYYASTGKWCPPGHRYGEAEVIAPTCISAGYTKYTCIACGHSYTEAPVDALGHTPAAAIQKNVNPATCFESGSYDSVVYCGVCDEEISRTPTVIPVLEHNYVDGFCEHCKQPKVTFTVLHNLALRQEVQIGYWIQVETAAQVEETGILIWDEAAYLAEDQHDINSDSAVKPTLTSRQGYMMGYGEGILAQNLDTVYYAIPYIKTTDGKYYYAKNADEYAAPDYATEMSGTSAKVQAVVRDLLNFGTNAKYYFAVRGGADTNTITAINSVLPEESRALSYTDSMKITGIIPQKNTSATLACNWRYSTADLKESFHLNHFADENKAFTQMLYWDEEKYASAAEPLTKASATRSDLVVTSRNMGSDSEPDMTSVATIDKIYAKDLYDWQYVCMYNSTDDSYGTIRADSVAAYLTRKMNQIENLSAEEKTTADSYLYETCKAMLAYGTSAKAYANE